MLQNPHRLYCDSHTGTFQNFHIPCPSATDTSYARSFGNLAKSMLVLGHTENWQFCGLFSKWSRAARQKEVYCAQCPFMIYGTLLSQKQYNSLTHISWHYSKSKGLVSHCTLFPPLYTFSPLGQPDHMVQATRLLALEPGLTAEPFLPQAPAKLQPFVLPGIWARQVFLGVKCVTSDPKEDLKVLYFFL